MKKPVQLMEIIPYFSEAEVAELALVDGSETVVPGDIVFAVFQEYMLRFCILEGESTAALKTNFIFFKYKPWLSVRSPDIIRTLNTIYESYDPLSDYQIHEEELKLHNDGEDTTTITNTYDYEVSDEADSQNLPTYSNYVTTFDNATPRLESRREDQGKRITHTVASDPEKNQKTTSYTHTEAEMTVGTDTVAADKIDYRKRDASGHVHRSAQQLAKETVDLYKQSVIQGFLKEFIDKYTYYVGIEGRCFL